MGSRGLLPHRVLDSVRLWGALLQLALWIFLSLGFSVVPSGH
ncbi:MAG: hypothetical protein ACI9VS_001288 [Candidatus Binatia bacterium]|jgi:hypothetical protein